MEKIQKQHIHSGEKREFKQQYELERTGGGRLAREIFEAVTNKTDGWSANEDRLDGGITIEKYNELVARTDAKMKEIDNEILRLEKTRKESTFDVSYLLKLASMAEDLIKSSKVDVKNEILRLLLSNLETSRKKVSFNLLEPFCYIKKIGLSFNVAPPARLAPQVRRPAFCRFFDKKNGSPGQTRTVGPTSRFCRFLQKMAPPARLAP